MNTTTALFPAATPSLPTNDGEAIDFALRHLEPWEVVTFLQDWRNGANMSAWLPMVDVAARDQGVSTVSIPYN